VAPPAPPLGAFGALVGAPAAPIWVTAAFGGGETSNEKNLRRQLTPPSAAIKKR